jgi:hypothetical protein
MVPRIVARNEIQGLQAGLAQNLTVRQGKKLHDTLYIPEFAIVTYCTQP